jgi:hypothetical protein
MIEDMPLSYQSWWGENFRTGNRPPSILELLSLTQAVPLATSAGQLQRGTLFSFANTALD